MNTRPEDTNPVLVSIGATTAIGFTAESTAIAVRAGIAGFLDHPYLVDMNGDPFVIAADPGLDFLMTLEERLEKLAVRALNEALNRLRAAISQNISYRLSLFLGLPEPRPGNGEQSADLLMESMRELLINAGGSSEIKVSRNGHASGLMALEAATRAIRSGTVDFALVGGVDSYLDAENLGWIEDCEQLHNATNAYGFIPGEAAGFCVLCSTRTASQCQLTPLGEIIAVGTAREDCRIKTDTICLGLGLTAVFKQVLAYLPGLEVKIDNVICDQNGETYRADEFGFTLIRTNQHFLDAAGFIAPADCWGDVGAASGPLFIVLAAEAARKGYASGPHTLLWASSEGGERAAAIFRAAVQYRG